MTQKPFVLIVDDEPDVLFMLEAGLREEGFPTAAAGDGATALHRVQHSAPDVILLDLMMPMIDGWTVIENLAAKAHRPALVIVSARTSPIDMALADRLGADAYVTKPFTFDELTRTILEAAARPEEARDRHRERVLRDLSATLVAD